MPRSIFGWDLPPGCKSSDIPGNGPEWCEVCLHNFDACKCPECPTCGEVGSESCYAELHQPGHGLRLSPDQLMLRAQALAEE